VYCKDCLASGTPARSRRWNGWAVVSIFLTVVMLPIFLVWAVNVSAPEFSDRLIGWWLLMALGGLVTGIIGRYLIRRSRGAERGVWMANIGILVNGLFLALAVGSMVFVMLMPY